MIASLGIFVAYTVLLSCGPGVRDAETGKRVPSTFEQVRLM